MYSQRLEFSFPTSNNIFKLLLARGWNMLETAETEIRQDQTKIKKNVNCFTLPSPICLLEGHFTVIAMSSGLSQLGSESYNFITESLL